VSKKQTETSGEGSLVQPMIDELKAGSPPELPRDDETPPPRGPLHPPEPGDRHQRHEERRDSEPEG
jgi:hypothetical protein